MTRPSVGDGRSTTLDSTTWASSDQHDLVSIGSGYSSVNSSSTSLGKRAMPDTYSHERSQTPSNAPSPSSQLSNLVCNVCRTTGRRPHGLVGPSTTILGDKLYVFGGLRISEGYGRLVNDLYELDLIRRHWTKIDTKGDIPSSRYWHSVCALGDSKLVLYGGMAPDAPAAAGAAASGAKPSNVHVVLSDIHIYDAHTETWMKIHTRNAPAGRYAHCATILPSSAVFASAEAPLSAIHRNPSDGSANTGSTGVAIDGTGGAEMIIVGGQDGTNQFIEEISVFNLRSLQWTSTSRTDWHNSGAYRSAIAPLLSMKAEEVGAGLDAVAEQDEYDDASCSGSPMLVFSNHNFKDVKLNLQVRLVNGQLVERPMRTETSPPPLRFPSGGIISNRFVVAGTHISSKEEEFAIWALDLRALTWAKIDVASNIFNSGSWNRGVLWSRRNTFVVLGDRQRSLGEDYKERRVNFGEVSLVQLEAFGLYDNPIKAAPMSSYISASAPADRTPASKATHGGSVLTPMAISLGQAAMDASALADMEFLTLEGTRVPVNSRVVARRWGAVFNALVREAGQPSGTVDTDTFRPGAMSVLSRDSTITITPSDRVGLSDAASLASLGGQSTAAASWITTSSSETLDVRNLSATQRSRIIYLPHSTAVVNALIYYLYMSALPPPSSPLAGTNILCSLLLLARPYQVDGLLEAVIERLHANLNAQTAGIIFNAAATAAGGQSALDMGAESLPMSLRSPFTGPSSNADRSLLRIDTAAANSGSGTSDALLSAASTTSAASGDRVPRRDVWAGGWSAVIGLQKRGLRGMMEHALRERAAAAGAGGKEPELGLGIR